MAILSYRPEALLEKKIEYCDLLQISEQEFMKAAKNAPGLFSITPQKVASTVDECANKLGVERDKILELLLKNPTCFTFKSDSIVKKTNLYKYKDIVQNSKAESLKLTTLSQENIFIQILTALIKKQIKAKGLTPNTLADFVKSNPERVYNFVLPEHELNEEFIDFANKFFEKHVGCANLNFVIR